MSLAELKKRYQETILDGMARALWIMAFSEWSDENNKCRWCERAIWSQDPDHPHVMGEDLEWIDESGSGDCPDSDEGHEPSEHGASGIEFSGEDLDDVVPETPDAAYLAAHDLQKLLAASEGVKKEASAMSELFEMAMTVHTGEPFQFGEDDDKRADSKKKREKQHAKLELAEKFGHDIAMESLGHGTGWGDDHVTKRDNAEFAPAIPRFHVHYDGEELTWGGEAREPGNLKGEDRSRTGTQEARYAAADLPITAGKLGKLDVINNDQASFHDHRFVVQIARSKFLVWADDDGDALDEVIDYIADQPPTLGGLLADETYEERFKDALKKFKGNRDKADEEASEGLYMGGNAGNYVDTSEVHITRDPTREQLYQIADVAQNPSSSKRGRRKNPDIGDEWGPGGAESGELVMMVESAIDSKGPLAAYKPKVFSPLSPEGIVERTTEALVAERLHKRTNAPIQRSVFITLHPAAAAKALNAAIYAEHGAKLEGKFLVAHAGRLLDQLCEQLDRTWPMPNATWTVIPYGWGFMALTDNDDRDDGKIDQPSESATFAIGLE
jgi:hypothetical protein